MKRVIRNNCFETNSSSQHSLVITKRDEYIDPKEIVWDCNKPDQHPEETIYLSSDGIWSLYHLDEGYGRWPFQLLTTFGDKLKYAMCEYLGCLYEDDPLWEPIYNSFKVIVKELLPEFEDFRFSTKDVDIYVDKDGNDILTKDLHYDYWDSENNLPKYYYLDKNGNKQPAIFNEEYYMEMPNIGMIDHQSMGLLKNFIKDTDISLKEFLTNRKYIVVIDSDETCDWSKYKNSGIINLDFIICEYDKSEDDIEWLEWLRENGEENEKNRD